MDIVTYFVTGLRVGERTHVDIKLRKKWTEETPAIRVRRKGGTAYEIVGKSGTWTADLDADDYILTIELPELGADVWPGLELTAGTQLIVVTERSEGKMLAWDATATGSDPKDPWPPPAVAGPPRPRAIDYTDWFQKTFSKLRETMLFPSSL